MIARASERPTVFLAVHFLADRADRYVRCGYPTSGISAASTSFTAITGPHYVGVTIDRGIGRRLKEHLKDRHDGTWDRFSWYGFKRALTGRNIVGLSDLGQMASAKMVENRVMIAELEALLIHAMGLQNIRQTRFPQGERWIQAKNHERADYLEKLTPCRRPV